MFLKEGLHPHYHGPWSKQALGLGFVLLASCSRTDTARGGCQSFQHNHPFSIFTPRLSHPGIWGHSHHGSDHAYEGAKWHQALKVFTLPHVFCPNSHGILT